MLRNTEFAIVDVETTGLFPKAGDRIIEIAIIRVDSRGKSLHDYATLINPQRDLGPIHIHGLTARDVIHAPMFEEVAGDVLSLLGGAVVVAHNAEFDMRFVKSEMARIGCDLPDPPLLCTMRLARRVGVTIPSRKLEALCRYFGITVARAHSAYADACATAELFNECVARLGNRDALSLAEIGVQAPVIPASCWPSRRRSGRSYRRRDAAQRGALEPPYLARLVAELPATGDSDADLDPYLALLDRVLEDRRVTRDEVAELQFVVAELGIPGHRVKHAHQLYMHDLMEVALEDNVITDSEQTDFEEVRTLLGISDAEYARLLDDAKQGGTAGGDVRGRHVMPRAPVTGRSVCFTGTFVCRIDNEPATRAFAEEVAAKNGMVVKKTVTKKLHYLVTPDPDSMSGKARKAREYGVRIIAEPVFWRMMGIQVG
ncbi:MAG: hypothetical protein JSV19_05045 [Phycisphaerales bacterium]|nr:MAG: hypothetical protein JSV19_05045 [Phycisphaerales bacterium]